MMSCLTISRGYGPGKHVLPLRDLPAPAPTSMGLPPRPLYTGVYRWALGSFQALLAFSRLFPSLLSDFPLAGRQASQTL
jgi:hypothetical protein